MDFPLTKNQDITLTIDAMGSEGQGIGRYQGLAVFVEGALPGERVAAKVIKANKSYAVGKLLSVIDKSPHRVQPPCPVFSRCGGCAVQHLEYQKQLDFKTQLVIDALARIGGVQNAAELVRPCLGMERPFRYRNKGAFPAGQTPQGLRLGLFAARSHRLIPVDDCMIQDEKTVEVMNAALAWAMENNVFAYDEGHLEGALRHVAVRVNRQKQWVAVVVTRSKLPAEPALVRKLREIQGCVGIVHNINPGDTNVIYGQRFRTVYGSQTLYEELLGHKFGVSAQSFFQVNLEQTQKLYQTAVDFAQLGPTTRVIDAYCGIGSLSLALAKKAKWVTGVEIVEQSIQSAVDNAALNGVENVDFICEAAEKALPRLVKGGNTDVVVLDPPRKGCDGAFIDALGGCGAKRIIYVSCNPATMARDIKPLTERGYEVMAAQPVDMFCQTGHVECVLSLHLTNSQKP